TGDLVITSGQDKTTRFWEATTGKSLGEPLRHQEIVDVLVRSADSKALLTIDNLGNVQLWHVPSGKPTGRPIRYPRVPGKYVAVALSPNTKTVLLESPGEPPNAGSSEYRAELWDTGPGQRRGEPLRHLDRIAALAFSRDGRMAATASFDNTV